MPPESMLEPSQIDFPLFFKCYTKLNAHFAIFTACHGNSLFMSVRICWQPSPVLQGTTHTYDIYACMCTQNTKLMLSASSPTTIPLYNLQCSPYHKIGILSTGTFFNSILAARNGCLFLRGVYFHGVLFNFLVVCSCVGLAVIYFRTRGSFSVQYLQLSATRDSQQSINHCQPCSPMQSAQNQRIHERFLLIPGYVLSRGLA